MKTAVSLYLLVGALLTGPAIAETTRTVDWWKAHSAERATKLKECRDDPGRLGKTADCTNVEKAEMQVQISKHGFYLRPMTKEELGPTPWRMDNPANPMPFTRK